MKFTYLKIFSKESLKNNPKTNTSKQTVEREILENKI